MEEEIVAVCGHPNLYDTISYLYRDWTKKEIAWRKVSKEVGLPGKFIKCYLIPAIGFTFRSIKKTSILKVICLWSCGQTWQGMNSEFLQIGIMM